MTDLDHALSRLASTDIDAELGGLEDDVWRGLSAQEAANRRAAAIKPFGAAGVIGAMILGVVAGGLVTPSSQATELEVFSPVAALAPSTLLGGPG